MGKSTRFVSKIGYHIFFSRCLVNDIAKTLREVYFRDSGYTVQILSQLHHIKCQPTLVKMETPIYAHITAKVRSVIHFYTTKIGWGYIG